MHPQKKRANAGFTLIEVLVAMVIFAIASAATVSLMYHSTRMVAENSSSSQAITVAQRVLEDLRTLDYEDIEDGSFSYTWAAKNKTFNASWSVYEDAPEAGLKTIIVTVTWDGKGGTKSYETHTIYSQITA